MVKRLLALGLTFRNFATFNLVKNLATIDAHGYEFYIRITIVGLLLEGLAACEKW